jgi:uncharacterized protein YjbJ (UPF0337 family)
MSTETVSGKFDQLKGQVKQSFGEATGNDRLANEGVADQVKGHVKEAWGNTKDAARSVSRDANTDAEVEHAHAKAEGERAAHNVRDGIAHAAHAVKDAVVGTTDRVKANH